MFTCVQCAHWIIGSAFTFLCSRIFLVCFINKFWKYAHSQCANQLTAYGNVRAYPQSAGVRMRIGAVRAYFGRLWAHFQWRTCAHSFWRSVRIFWARCAHTSVWSARFISYFCMFSQNTLFYRVRIHVVWFNDVIVECTQRFPLNKVCAHTFCECAHSVWLNAHHSEFSQAMRIGDSWFSWNHMSTCNVLTINIQFSACFRALSLEKCAHSALCAHSNVLDVFL